MEERIQKILARSGYGSRRSCEELIVAGRVTVNGQRAILGTKADASRDKLAVDGVVLDYKEPEFIYIALHKPRNVLSDVDPNDPRQTVRDLVPVSGHLFAVGRLDLDSEGLIILTNDGELANRLTHPRYGHEKEYNVLVATRPDEDQLNAWRRGVVLEDGYKTAPAQVNVDSLAGKGTWLRIIMREGRKRQIREVGSRIGLPVVKLIRVRIDSILLGNLKPREWRHLTGDEVKRLRISAKLETGPIETPKYNKRTIPDQENRPLARRPMGTRSQPQKGNRPPGFGNEKPSTWRPGAKPSGQKPTGSSRPATQKPGGSKPAQNTETRFIKKGPPKK